jgi:hypothetical protein
MGDVEVDQEPQRDVREFQVCENLGQVNLLQLFDAFELDTQAVLTR